MGKEELIMRGGRKGVQQISDGLQAPSRMVPLCPIFAKYRW